MMSMSFSRLCYRPHKLNQTTQTWTKTLATSHSCPGSTIDIRPLGERIASSKTHTLFKTELMEAIRLVLPAGKKIAEHKAPGEITVQCLEGRVKFEIGDESHDMRAGDFLYLEAAKPHAVEAIEDSSVLVTIVFDHVDK